MHKFSPKYKGEPVDEVQEHHQPVQPDELAKWVKFYINYIKMGRSKHYCQMKLSRKRIRGEYFQKVQNEVLKQFRWNPKSKTWSEIEHNTCAVK